MTGLEATFWFAVFWVIFLLFCASNVPVMCQRAAHFLADHLRHGGTR